MSSGDSLKFMLYKFVLSPTSVSFLCGFASASIVACLISSSNKIIQCLNGKSQVSEKNADDGAEEDVSDNSSLSYGLSPTIIRWISIDDIASRIGEFPGLRRRSHWPWDQMKRSLRESHENLTSQTNSNVLREENGKGIETEDCLAIPDPSKVDRGNVYHDDASDSACKKGINYLDDDKSGLCIGNIFGMDVGGTLAKLVYFEQKAESSSHLQRLHDRQMSYQQKASARAVIMSRRGFLTSAGEVITGTHSCVQDSNFRLPYMTRSMSSFAVVKSLEHSRRFSFSMNSPKRDNGKVPKNNNMSSRTSSRKLRRKHSSSSDDDIELIKLLRQKSLPDDVAEYFKTIHLPSSYSGQHNEENSESREDYSTKMDWDEYKESLLGVSKTKSLRRSHSMVELTDNRDHAEALDRFYAFARRLDSYREGVKDEKLSFYSHKLGGEFHFLRFETRRMQHAMDLIRANKLHVNIKEMGGTGGGAHRFADQWEKELGIKMKKHDELDSLVVGLQFVLSNVVGECYTFRPKRSKSASSPTSSLVSPPETPENLRSISPPSSRSFESDDLIDESENASDEDNFGQGRGDVWWWSRKVQRDTISDSSTYPYLVVTIGTGVSILRVDGPRKYARVSGSTIGGGTYLGLIRLLTDVDDYDDIMRLAEKGDPTKCDMLVGDIYGENAEALKKLGLPSNLVASSFGKLVTKEDPASGLKQEDLARALLLMITINIGQVAYLNAQLTKTSRIYFVGNFLRENKSSQRRLSYAIHYWSKGKMEALFLEHEGYFGALGAFLLNSNFHLGNQQNPSNTD